MTVDPADQPVEASETEDVKLTDQIVIKDEIEVVHTPGPESEADDEDE